MTKNSINKHNRGILNAASGRHCGMIYKCDFCKKKIKAVKEKFLSVKLQDIKNENSYSQIRHLHIDCYKRVFKAFRKLKKIDKYVKTNEKDWKNDS